MHLKSFRTIFYPAGVAWSEHNAARLSAALSFYAILSLAPLLVVAVTIAAFVLGTGTVQATLYEEAMASLGKGAADLFADLAKRASQPATSVFATIAAILIAVYAASGLFNQIVDSVEYIWGIRREGSPVKLFLKSRLKSVAFLFGFLVLFVTWLCADAILGWLARTSGGFAGWPFISLFASIVLATLVFAIAFRSIPRNQVLWRDVWPGAITTGLGFSLAKSALSLYFSYSGVAAAYGSAGALVLILLWIYYSAQVFFYGVEVTKVVATLRHNAEIVDLE